MKPEEYTRRVIGGIQRWYVILFRVLLFVYGRVIYISRYALCRATNSVMYVPRSPICAAPICHLRLDPSGPI